VSGYRLGPAADHRLDEIFVYMRERFGEAQAEAYLHGIFERFGEIAKRKILWRVIPAEFEVDGYFCKYQHHFIYWRELANGAVGIVTILHERMHQIDRFKEDREG
jgi:toxin ParE1/3/4